ncbi:hypothetical protein ACJBUE_19450 (plasmid) [Ralstonia syzygii subsp. celebesensis]|uniref:hypothetical protein n=1 Tax=Ralstonia syzygii TaxID=28097 RepID=UPI00387E17FB
MGIATDSGKKEQVRIVMATRSDRQNAPATPANRPRETDTVIVASPACAIPDSVAETTRGKRDSVALIAPGTHFVELP